MEPGWSDKVRDVADRDFVRPARYSRSRVRIRFGDLKSKMLPVGFPAQNANQIASSIESEKFWRTLGLEMCTPKGQSRRVDTVFDSIHLAYAAIAGVDLFITNDKDLPKLHFPEIKFIAGQDTNLL